MHKVSTCCDSIFSVGLSEASDVEKVFPRSVNIATLNIDNFVTLSIVRHIAIIQTTSVILLVTPLETNLSDFKCKFSWKKLY